MLATTIASLSAVALAPLHGQQTPTARNWMPAPAVFPRGAQMAVVQGDPSKAGEFTVELSMPDGYQIAPHFHPTNEHVVVQSGTLLVGMGDTLDVNATHPLNAGQSADMPPQMHHYVIAKGPTVVSVTAKGPFAMTYVHPADDPRGAPSSH
jgi:quercetin dioxygenase-like cupin family protein